MALTQIDFPAEGAADWTDFIDMAKDWIVGHINIGLTNFDNDSLPAIAQGSKCEIGGSYFFAASDQAVTGSATASSVNYIYIETDGDVVWSTTAPTWDDTKSGWYNGTDRAVARLYRDGSSNYLDKYVYSQNQISVIREVDAGGLLLPKVLDIGDWNMDTTQNKSVNHGLGSAWKGIRSIDIIVRNDLDDAYQRHNVNTATSQLQVSNINATVITLTRETGVGFDGTGWDSTSYNRGWVTVWYDPS
jgi:hypothetical protein